MLLEGIFPILPTGKAELFLFLCGALGAIMLIYSQFVEAENRRDIIRILGSLGLLFYAIYIENLIFIIVSAGIGIAAFVEFIEILLGYHKHTPHEIKEYIKKYKRKH
ncbi:MAG: hypothetical protein ABII02_03210 [Candidatus Magasanikbacteria bacterium]